MGLDENCLEVFGGVFESEQAVEEYMKIVDGKLIKRQNNGLIKVITGIRRCGKSYLLNTLFYNYLIENKYLEV